MLFHALFLLNLRPTIIDCLVCRPLLPISFYSLLFIITICLVLLLLLLPPFSSSSSSLSSSSASTSSSYAPASTLFPSPVNLRLPTLTMYTKLLCPNATMEVVPSISMMVLGHCKENSPRRNARYSPRIQPLGP